MKKRLFVLLACMACVVSGQRAAVAATGTSRHGGDWDERRLTESDSEEIHRTFAGGARSLQVVVDNMSGSIEVVGHDVDRVELVARRTNQARSPEKLEEAKREVKLVVEEEAGVVRLFVDGPQRCPDGSVRELGVRHYGYRVHFDFTLRVPRHAEVDLRTVNDGEIRVTGVRGGYDVENINGGIEMLDVGGAGRVYALNGEVHVSFERNPDGESSFGSLNGDVEIEFRRDLAAELRLKTFNGEVYSDFEVSAVPREVPEREQRDGKNFYRAGKGFGVRVGSGGPRLEFNAFNGDIRIVKRD
jgi:hypothetical protein